MSVAEETLSPEAGKYLAHKKEVARLAIEAAQEHLEQWERIEEAAEQEKSPTRDRMVVTDDQKEFVATYRWEINWKNGFVTVQLVDGSIMPYQYGKWCLYSYAVEHFDISNGDITIDDPREEEQ